MDGGLEPLRQHGVDDLRIDQVGPCGLQRRLSGRPPHDVGAQRKPALLGDVAEHVARTEEVRARRPDVAPIRSAISSSWGCTRRLAPPPMPTTTAFDGVNRCAKSAGSVVKSDANDCAPRATPSNRKASSGKTRRNRPRIMLVTAYCVPLLLSDPHRDAEVDVPREERPRDVGAGAVQVRLGHARDARVGQRVNAAPEPVLHAAPSCQATPPY